MKKVWKNQSKVGKYEKNDSNKELKLDILIVKLI